MKTITASSYLLLSEIEVNDQVKNPDPIFKVNLFGESIDDEPVNTIYIKFYLCTKKLVNEYENEIRAIIKHHSLKALAFKAEYLNGDSLILNI